MLGANNKLVLADGLCWFWLLMR